MKKLKVILPIIAGLLALVLCVLIIHHFTHPIKLDSSGQLSLEDTALLTAEISELGRKGEHYPTVELYSWVRLGHNVYYLMELDGKLGYAILIEGLNGGYKLEGISHGTGDFREGIVVHNGTKYLLAAGRNREPRIAKITAAMDGILYEFVIDDDGDHYFFCVELDPQPQSSDLNRGDVVFYDRDGNDITDAYILTGGGFHAL